jgi:DNA-directed RNA polymerase specialized sigma24 family protein
MRRLPAEPEIAPGVQGGERAELRRLMVRLADGDRAAFRPAFALLWPRLRAFAARCVAAADAEDVAQAALLRVFSRASEYDAERDALAWALGIAAWECRTLRRRRQRRREDHVAPPDPPDPGEPDLRLEARAGRAYELGRLRAALRLAPLVLAAAGAAIVCGRPLAVTCALAVALLLLSVGLAYAGGSAGRAVSPGLLAGAAPLAAPLLMATVGHACFGPVCASLGLPACILGGSLAGVFLARTTARRDADLLFVLAALAVAAMTGSLGCTIAGVAGVLGMLAGVVVGGAPVLVAARR